jgi:threonine dehydrogenase-like Zn-dependent dehydrogenase
VKKLSVSNRSVKFVDEADPHIEDGWVVVKMKAIPICGSDKGAYFGAEPCDSAGHEGSGFILESKSPQHKPGARVVLWPLTSCNKCFNCLRGDYIYCRHRPEPIQGQFRELVAKPAHLCMPLPDDIPFDVGSMACCALGPSFGAARTLQLKPSDTLLVTGLGPVGLGAVTVGKFFGARVIGVDVQKWRREKAREIGADVTLDATSTDLRQAIRELTLDNGVEKAFDCSGNPTAQRLCLDAAGIRGGVAFIGENHKELAVTPSNDFIRKGLTLYGSWHFNANDYPMMVELLRRSPAVRKLISHTFPFEQAPEAFSTFFQESGAAAKVVMTVG